MSRERMITRTLVQSDVTVMVVDVTESKVENKTYTLGGQYTTDTALKKLKKLYEDDTIKVVSVISIDERELLLGMTEEDFIKYSTVLPKR